MAYQQPDLPYAEDALEPHISARTLSFHYGKHHATYVKNYNALVTGTPYDEQSIEEVIRATVSNQETIGIYNNGAQAWNHTFYWNSLSPAGGGEPTGELARKIDEDFGSFEALKEALKTAGATQFGSGWAWLVLDNGKLKVTKTSNADSPLIHNQVPLLTFDVWEHAYYLDYQNRRPDHIAEVIANLLDWDFANNNFLAAH